MAVILACNSIKAVDWLFIELLSISSNLNICKIPLSTFLPTRTVPKSRKKESALCSWFKVVGIRTSVSFGGFKFGLFTLKCVLSRFV